MTRSHAGTVILLQCSRFSLRTLQGVFIAIVATVFSALSANTGFGAAPPVPHLDGFIALGSVLDDHSSPWGLLLSADRRTLVFLAQQDITDASRVLKAIGESTGGKTHVFVTHGHVNEPLLKNLLAVAQRRGFQPGNCLVECSCNGNLARTPNAKVVSTFFPKTTVYAVGHGYNLELGTSANGTIIFRATKPGEVQPLEPAEVFRAYRRGAATNANDFARRLPGSWRFLRPSGGAMAGTLPGTAARIGNVGLGVGSKLGAAGLGSALSAGPYTYFVAVLEDMGTEMVGNVGTKYSGMIDVNSGPIPKYQRWGNSSGKYVREVVPVGGSHPGRLGWEVRTYRVNPGGSLVSRLFGDVTEDLKLIDTQLTYTDPCRVP